MSQFSDEFIPLVCPQCGDHIKLTEAQYKASFIVASDKSIMYIGVDSAKDGAKCESCGTEFDRNTKFRPTGNAMSIIATLDGESTIVMGNNNTVVGARGVFIRGDVSGNLIVTGSSNKVIGRKPDSTDIITGDNNEIS